MTPTVRRDRALKRFAVFIVVAIAVGLVWFIGEALLSRTPHRDALRSAHDDAVRAGRRYYRLLVEQHGERGAAERLALLLVESAQ